MMLVMSRRSVFYVAFEHMKVGLFVVFIWLVVVSLLLSCRCCRWGCGMAGLDCLGL